MSGPLVPSSVTSTTPSCTSMGSAVRLVERRGHPSLIVWDFPETAAVQYVILAGSSDDDKQQRAVEWWRTVGAKKESVVGRDTVDDAQMGRRRAGLPQVMHWDGDESGDTVHDTLHLLYEREWDGGRAIYSRGRTQRVGCIAERRVTSHGAQLPSYVPLSSPHAVATTDGCDSRARKALLPDGRANGSSRDHTLQVGTAAERYGLDHGAPSPLGLPSSLLYGAATTGCCDVRARKAPPTEGCGHVYSRDRAPRVGPTAGPQGKDRDEPSPPKVPSPPPHAGGRRICKYSMCRTVRIRRNLTTTKTTTSLPVRTTPTPDPRPAVDTNTPPGPPVARKVRG